MRAMIQPSVYTAIEEQYRAARPVTRDDYESGVDEEDSISGAMMKGLREAVHGERDGYVWYSQLSKLRGRGLGALEKETGADVIVEIEVLDSDGDVVAQKGLLGQAKKDWSTRDGRLVEQASKMETYAPGAAIVIDYTIDGASACKASEAIRADGRIVDLPLDALKPLGVLLADDFLSCAIGQAGMTYDRDRKQIVFTSPAGARRLTYSAGYHLLTSIAPDSQDARERARRATARFIHGQIVRPVDLVRDRRGVLGLFHPDARMRVLEHLPNGYVRLEVGADPRFHPAVTLLIDVHQDDIELV